MKSFFCAFTILFSTSAWAQETSNARPLFFPAEKNNLQVLPQRFEYALMENGDIHIGDIFIEQSKLNFQISESAGDYQLSFQWPGGLLHEGQLIVKNNIGKAIVSQKINPVPSKERSENIQYTLPIRKEQVEDMKYSPFMSFCVYREEADTRIYLCSQELYLNYRNGPLTINPRAENRRTAQVEINGQVVGNQGYIFLNSQKEQIVFKTFARSGATLEIQTRRKEVDFKDISLSEDGKTILLTASGAEPADASAVKKISNTEWQAQLAVSRPYLFLKGDGDIPMRQEFLVRGSLPKESDRAFINHNVRNRSYNSKLQVNVQLPKNTEAKALDKNARVEKISDDEVRWSIQNISRHPKGRRYLLLKKDNSQFISAQDFFQARPFEVALALSYFNPSQVIYAKAHLLGWLNAGDLHWGLGLQQDQHLTTNSSEAKIDITTVDAFYRFRSGLYLHDETWGLSLHDQMIQLESTSFNLLGVGVFTHQKSPDSWEPWLTWYQVHARYFFGSTVSGVKIKQALQLNWVAYRPLGDDLFFTYGLDLNHYILDPAGRSKELQVGINAGIRYRF